MSMLLSALGNAPSASVTASPAAARGTAALSPRSAAAEADGPGAASSPLQDQLLLSPEAQRKLEEEKSTAQPGGEALTEDETQEVARLAQRDQEVRRHEQAHIAAGGQYVQGGAQFTFSQGPDGRQYATGGEVSINTGEEGSPEATIQKARAVRRAALAPAQPSAQDRQVAAQAAQLEIQARQELAAEGKEPAEASSAPGEEVTPAPPGDRRAREAYASASASAFEPRSTLSLSV